MKSPSIQTLLALTAILVNGVWFFLWRNFCTGFPGPCGTAALQNSVLMQACSVPSLLLVWFGLRASCEAMVPNAVPRFLARLPFVLLLTFTIARLPIRLLLEEPRRFSDMM